MIDLSFPIREIELFLLILVRVSCFVFTAPFFSLNNVPKRVKIGLSFFIAMLLYQVLIPMEYPDYNTMIGYTIIVIKEATTGLVIGLGAQLCVLILQFSGRIIDMEIGLSMASQFDPSTRQNTTLSGLMYQYGAYLIMLVTGMHRFIINALVETYTLIPVNGMRMQTGTLLDALIDFMGSYIMIGFLIAMPIFATITLMNIVLGLLAKLAPQMNMFAVGIQLKLLAGLSVMVLTVTMLPTATNIICEQMQMVMVTIVKALS